MRNLVFKLADGTVVKTQAEAQASGQRYTMECENIIEEYDTARLTETQARLRRSLA